MNTTDLEIASSAYERQINQIIEGDDDTSKYVDELEDNYDAGDYEVASPEDFVKDVEISYVTKIKKHIYCISCFHTGREAYQIQLQ